MNVLQVSAEIFPLLKTGGLADIAGALPAALNAAGCEVRVLLPGFAPIMADLQSSQVLAELTAPWGERVVLLQGVLGSLGIGAYVIDVPHLYLRPGTPYEDEQRQPYPDNHLRFALLGWMAAQLACGLDTHWPPAVVHSHDWHAALTSAYLAFGPARGRRVASVYTVHNLAYQGVFAPIHFFDLGLPPHAFSVNGLEFHGQLSFMKAGLYYADHITTVSPTYAQEIQTPEQGCGLDGLLRARAHDLSGILNAVDEAVWNPATDALIPHAFETTKPAGKARCKAALQQELGLALAPDAPLFGVVSRLTEQKGLSLVLGVIDDLIARGGQLVVLGTGDTSLEAAFRARAAANPQAVSVRIGYDEAYAHRIFSATDVTLVPSRFEPCGLTQMYGLKYGSLPLVHRVGGLADTVVDCALENLADGTANGFVFHDFTPEALDLAMRRALALYARKSEWHSVRQRAMQQSLGWDTAAAQYVALYRHLLV
ncbi:MAG: glycogen synthase GlgA [Rhodoferax sp.]|uniref:glycogen synthase GlgA n=1 Tax=Rhodoferax sp. TaxID=50421 RepID=UPI0008AF908B|nr:glycogen synthase GlgA [Rhodoferax sp.]MDP2678890.1 glycogen synthase GlgA [Rhodoferax sp.]OGB55889.1 MAG: starch synthase [Burkholderiales bacterium RIFOXYD12_FULL_59_19]OGB80959.1 MAG: starch synthase [Burkholderiales bacterium RIFOXYC12_FULL_60_6]